MTTKSCSTEKVISFLFFCEIWNGRSEITSVFLFVQHHPEQTRVVNDHPCIFQIPLMPHLQIWNSHYLNMFGGSKVKLSWKIKRFSVLLVSSDSVIITYPIGKMGKFSKGTKFSFPGSPNGQDNKVWYSNPSHFRQGHYVPPRNWESIGSVHHWLLLVLQCPEQIIY